MRSLRVLTVVGLSIGAITLTAPAATACVLDSFGPQGVSGGPVTPDGTVGYSIRALGTDESPGDSPWVITAGGIEVARGMAVPDSGHEWVGSGTFKMPPLGAYEGKVTVEITFTDSAMRQAFQVDYDGTPAPAEPQTSAPETANGPPAIQQTPVPATQRVTEPAAGPRTGPRSNRARPRDVRRPAPRVYVKPRSTAPAARAPQASHVPTGVRQVRRALEPALAALRSRPAVRRSRPASRPGVDRAAPLAVRAISRRVAVDAPAVQARSRPATSAAGPGRTVLLLATGALLLALLAGGAGLAAIALRRRGPLDPESPDRLDEMEAELQELLAEERLRAEAAAGSPRMPVAP